VVPEGLATLYAFLGLVTPGLVYQLLRERARPALEETSFREASRIALTSAVLTTAAIMTVAALHLVQPTWFIDVQKWAAQGNAYLRANTALVAATVVTIVALACLYALLTSLVAERIAARSKTRVENSDVWYQLFVDDVPEGKVPWVLVQTGDGTRIWGHVDFFTTGRSLSDRELSLKGPELAVEPAGDWRVKTEDYWNRISVRASEIALLKVAYEPKVDRPRGRRASWPVVVWWRETVTGTERSAGPAAGSPGPGD